MKDHLVKKRSNNIFELMTNEPIDALLKTGGAPGANNLASYIFVVV